MLESLLALYPEAPIYTLFYDEQAMPSSITSRRVIFPKWLAPFKRIRKALLPIFPTVVESFDMSEFDFIISTSSCVAKGVIPNPDAKHICYLHSPMRYIWDQRHEYMESVKHIPGARLLISLFSAYLRNWDVNSASRVDRFVVNSNFVGERVKKYYGRDYSVIHPPIEVKDFEPSKPVSGQGYFLAAGAFVSYKRFDLAIKACQQQNKKLIVAGSGPMESRLRKLASEKTQFEISPDKERWTELLQGAEALLFPGVEDFGMVPIESMASGTPVIAYRRGGALDYIKPGHNGEFFDDQSEESLVGAIQTYSKSDYQSEQLISYAQGYKNERFLDEIKREITDLS